jgi:low temperature requirement protein LtrA
MTKRLVMNGIWMGGLLIVVSLILKYAQHAQMISPEVATRGGEVAIGLVLVLYANMMPKRIATGRRQVALRAGGWAFALAGLADAALWAFAPLSLAWPASMAVVGTGLAVCFGYTVWACAERA